MAKEKPLPYLQSGRNDFEWTARAFDLSTAGKLAVSITGTGVDTAVHAAGECPRCAHDVRYTHLETVSLPGASTLGPTGGGSGTVDGDESDGSIDGYITVDAACACNGEHPGRPADTARGCGIVFTSEVLVTP